jgi:hypothetical protein
MRRSEGYPLGEVVCVVLGGGSEARNGLVRPGVRAFPAADASVSADPASKSISKNTSREAEGGF